MSDPATQGPAKGATKETRCVAVVGPQSSGKTTLIESMLYAAGALQKRGRTTDGTTVSDTAPESRARHMSTELTPVRFSYLNDSWVLIDCPGAVDLIQETHQGMLMADAVIVVTEADPNKMLSLGSTLRFLDDHKIPHILFINKMDVAQGSARDILAAAQSQSTRPLVLRHIPIIDKNNTLTGYVDLVAERAYHYKLDQPSERIDLAKANGAGTEDARRTLLEKLSDFDDALMEKLLEDIVPDKAEVYKQLSKDLAEDLIVPVLIGAAEHQHGVTRLLKALRHEVPSAAETALRRSIPPGDLVTQIYKTIYAPHVGKMSLMRVWRGPLKDGDMLAGHRVTNMQDGAEPKLGKAKVMTIPTGDVVALTKLEGMFTGDILATDGHLKPKVWAIPPMPLYAVAVSTKDRKDDVKLGDGLRKLCEEDPSLSMQHVAETSELLLRGQGDIHLSIAVERLKRKFDLIVDVKHAQIPYRETIKRGTTHHARFKRQSGGHGQFADIKVEIKPLPRGSGVKFTDSIVGGVVPKNFIPAVEAGVRDNTTRGPLGFTVVDVAINLFDGQYHSVDSSDQAFRTAGRIAMTEGLPECEPVLLEPIDEVAVSVPNEFTSKVQRALTQHRAQIMGFDTREDWPGWDVIRVHMPESKMTNLITEIRSISQGVGTYDSKFSHYQELIGRDADKVVQVRKSQLQALHA
ncbi:MAG: elongation factor G [Rhodospirillaceae bacterium]|nr:elongation factor G [Rhodospirillaceae bacterium]